MKKFSNTYIFLYSTALVAVVAVVLAVVALSLKPRQDANQLTEKHQMILGTIMERPSAAEADALYAEKITEQTTENGDTYYLYDNGSIFRLDGNGLWGKIWGYIAFDKEFNVVGAVFDHASETPGLGAEIATDWFSAQFPGKSIIDNGAIRPIQLVKKSNRDASSRYEVDAITGGTMTSNGVNEMLQLCLAEKYASIIDQLRGNGAEAACCEAEAQPLQEAACCEAEAQPLREVVGEVIIADSNNR